MIHRFTERLFFTVNANVSFSWRVDSLITIPQNGRKYFAE